MDFEEAKELLVLHSFGYSDLNHPKMETGFLGSLRPYQGLREENFHEVMEAIIAVAEHLQKDAFIDKKLVSSLWNICEFGRYWGVDPDGMLRRNGLITAKDVKKLSYWIHNISYALALLLDGVDLESALESYRQYKQQSWED